MIPATAHFVWLGPTFPWIHGFAVHSAALLGEFDKVVLHHCDDLSATQGWDVATRSSNVECRKIDPGDIFRLDEHPGNVLAKLYERLEAPAARVNVLRAALLAREGGVYLDTDTVTLRSIRPLLDTGVFCGYEYIVRPGHVVRSRNPFLKIRARAQSAVRERFRRLPDGWRGFRRIEWMYHRAVNNAICAAAPGHAFMLELLERMASMPAEKQAVRYALGTHLLQQMVADYCGEDLTIHPPDLFYPFPPEISEHWFTPTSDVCLDEALTPEARVVHWYASVRTEHVVPKIEPEYVRANAHRQLFSALAQRILQEGHDAH